MHNNKTVLTFIGRITTDGTDVNSLTWWDIRKRFIWGSAKPVTYLQGPLVKIITSNMIKVSIPRGI